MEKKLLVVLVVVGLCSTVALALDPMGTATTALKQGQWSAGLDGVYSEMDLDFDAGFAVGFGTKVTFWEPSPELKVGFLAQASWTKLDVRTKYQGVTLNDNAYVGSREGLWSVPSEGELEFWEAVLALGGTYQLSPKFSVYGGPFYYWLIGDYNFEGDGVYTEVDEDDGLDVDIWPLTVQGSYDVEDEGCFGGYVGAKIDITDNAAFNAECQIAEGAMAFGTSIAWKF